MGSASSRSHEATQESPTSAGHGRTDERPAATAFLERETADTAPRLGRYCNTDPRFWFTAQVTLCKAEREVDLSTIPGRAA